MMLFSALIAMLVLQSIKPRRPFRARAMALRRARISAGIVVVLGGFWLFLRPVQASGQEAAIPKVGQLDAFSCQIERGRQIDAVRAQFQVPWLMQALDFRFGRLSKESLAQFTALARKKQAIELPQLVDKQSLLDESAMLAFRGELALALQSFLARAEEREREVRGEELYGKPVFKVAGMDFELQNTYEESKNSGEYRIARSLLHLEVAVKVGAGTAVATYDIDLKTGRSVVAAVTRAEDKSHRFFSGNVRYRLTPGLRVGGIEPSIWDVMGEHRLLKKYPECRDACLSRDFATQIVQKKHAKTGMSATSSTATVAAPADTRDGSSVRDY